MGAKRDSAALTVASVVNGVAAYATAVVASRGLDDLGFAAFSVSWSLWALSVALLVFPIQHWIIWRSARDGDTAAVRAALPRVFVAIAVIVVALFLAGSTERLFPEGRGWGVILAVIGISSASLGLGRGILASAGSYTGVAWVIGVENLLRLVAVGAAVYVFAHRPQWSVLGLAVGIVALIPFWSRLQLSRRESPTGVRVISELGALAGATALAHVLVQFPPAVAEWLDESPQRVSAIFATFSVGRAPFLVVLALSARLTAPLTRVLQKSASELRRAMSWFIAVSAGLTVASAALGYWIGPLVVSWFFGPGRALNAPETSLVAAGLTMATVGVVVTLALMAKNENRIAAASWALAATVALVLAGYWTSVPVAFVAGEAIASFLTVTRLWHRISSCYPSPSDKF